MYCSRLNFEAVGTGRFNGKQLCQVQFDQGVEYATLLIDQLEVMILIK